MERSDRHPSVDAADHPGGAAFGALLRRWRHLRERSQLALATSAGLSQRHLSFIETGRSRPGRAVVLALGEALAMPLADRNALLAAAGHAPAYAAGGLDDHDMSAVSAAVGRMLRQHEPFPAFVLDAGWDVVMANEAARRFLGRFIDLDRFARPRNILALMFDPEAMRPFIDDWRGVARSLLGRVQREAVGSAADERTERLMARLLGFAGVDRAWAIGDPAVAPVVPIGFAHGGRVLRYVSLVTTVGTPRTLAAEALRIECMFPADADTERAHAGLMAADPAV